MRNLCFKIKDQVWIDVDDQVDSQVDERIQLQVCIQIANLAMRPIGGYVLKLIEDQLPTKTGHRAPT